LSHSERSSIAFTRRAGRIAIAIVLPCAAVFAALAGPQRAVAQAPAAAVPAFAAVPRFAAAAALTASLPTSLGRSQVGGTCNPGSAIVHGNVVSLALHLKRVTTSINNPSNPGDAPDPLELRTYSGCLTSPEIDANPGDSLHIALSNELSTNDPTCGATPAPYLELPPGVGCFNTTNLHTHGLHVSPSGISDNVLLSVPPATVQPYVIDIPKNHPAGTFWYHAHMHGSTAVDVSSAVAGVLVVRGKRPYNPAEPPGLADIDTILHGPAPFHAPFPDTVFVLQQLAYGCFWTIDPTKPYDNLITTAGLYTTNDSNSSSPPPSASAPWTCRPTSPLPSGGVMTKGVVENFDSQLFSPTIWDTNGRFTSINGQVQPHIEVPAGQIQRWRFVHGGLHDTINLQIVAMTQTLAGNGSALSSRLIGKTRRSQATIVGQACSATAATLVPQFEIASDGLTRTKIHTINPAGEKPLPVATAPPMYGSNYLQPGYRSDILVAFPSPGDYCLLDQAAPPSERVNNGGGGGQGPSIPQLLAYVHVTAGHSVPKDQLQAYVEKTLYASNPQLPAAVRKGLLAGDITPWAPFTELAPPTPGATAPPYVHFNINVNSNPTGFTVNNKSYDPDSVQPVFVRQVGTTDDWTVNVTPGVAAEPHIFHIHVNPFEVMNVYKVTTGPSGVTRTSIYNADGTCKASMIGTDPQSLANQYCGMYHVFRDTLFIQNGYDVVLRTHYARYTGEFVLHCHILDHEDAGMMANVQIVNDPLHPPKPAKAHMPTMRMGSGH
jgi:FtsP/CotA-like multicopper oxidase with cupredoxin domain